MPLTRSRQRRRRSRGGLPQPLLEALDARPPNRCIEEAVVILARPRHRPAFWEVEEAVHVLGVPTRYVWTLSLWSTKRGRTKQLDHTPRATAV
jgi:hypothetical protein